MARSKTSFANQVFYQPILQLTRISILLFLLTALGKDTRMTIIGLIVLSALFGAACTLVVFLQCRPATMLWTGNKPAEYSCINQPQFFRITGLINVISKLNYKCDADISVANQVSRCPIDTVPSERCKG